MKNLKALLFVISLVSIGTTLSCKDDEEVTLTPTPTPTMADQAAGRYVVTDTAVFQQGPGTFVTSYSTVATSISKRDSTRVYLVDFPDLCDSTQADVTSSALIFVATTCPNTGDFLASRNGTTISYSYRQFGSTEHKGKAVKQ